MTKLLTAEEARIKAYSTQQDKFENEMLIIAEAINKSVAAGLMHCVIDTHISKDAEEELLSRGYIISSNTWRNEIATTISWEYGILTREEKNGH